MNNHPSVKVGVNIGGANENFTEQFLKEATLVKYKNNLDVLQVVANGDVIVIKIPEVFYYQTINEKQQVVREENPFTKTQFGYLTPVGEQRLLNTVNFVMDKVKLKNVDIQLMKNNSLM